LDEIADKQNHHPDVIQVNDFELEITLITHDTNSITEKDYFLANSIDELYRQLSFLI
jgi:pterin-4a-carbinolamine dehydratase